MPVAVKEKKKIDEILGFNREQLIDREKAKSANQWYTKELLESRKDEKTKHAMTTKATLCYIFKNNSVLLQMKKKEKFGGGHWNAPGGKVKEGESIFEAAVREVREETGLKISVESLKLVGKLFFVFEQEEQHNQEVIVFTTNNFSGKETAGEEGELKWFEKDKIPMGMLWPSDTYWLPMLLEGKSFTGHFFYDKYKDVKITRYQITEGLQE